MTQAETTQPQTDTIEVESIHQFVHHLTAWHTVKVQELQHMTQIPEGGVVMEINGVDRRMDGDFLAGFKAGIDLALMNLGALPFAAELEADEKAEPVPV